jgi:hypothetical protein
VHQELVSPNWKQAPNAEDEKHFGGVPLLREVLSVMGISPVTLVMRKTKRLGWHLASPEPLDR